MLHNGTNSFVEFAVTDRQKKFLFTDVYFGARRNDCDPLTVTGDAKLRSVDRPRLRAFVTFLPVLYDICVDWRHHPDPRMIAEIMVRWAPTGQCDHDRHCHRITASINGISDSRAGLSATSERCW